MTALADTQHQILAALTRICELLEKRDKPIVVSIRGVRDAVGVDGESSHEAPLHSTTTKKAETRPRLDSTDRVPDQEEYRMAPSQALSTTADTTSPPIMTNALAVHLILTEAHRAGLPMPTHFTGANRTYDHYASLDLHFDSLADLTEWALWREATIETRERPEVTHHMALVEWADWKIELRAIIAHEAVA
jgi:hypothetical protein